MSKSRQNSAKPERGIETLAQEKPVIFTERQNSAKPERGIETWLSTGTTASLHRQNSAKPERGIETFQLACRAPPTNLVRTALSPNAGLKHIHTFAIAHICPVSEQR